MRKKLLLLILSVMAFAGMTVAQDIWSASYYYDSNGNKQGAVHKNGVKQYESGFLNSFHGDCTDLEVVGNDVYWVRNCLYNGTDPTYSAVMKNNTSWLAMAGGSSTCGSYIYDLYRFPYNNSIYSTGCMDINGVQTAVIWKDNTETVHRQLGNGTYPSVAYGCTGADPSDNFLYSCGYQQNSNNSSDHKGVIWKGNSVLKDNITTYGKMYDITYYNGYLYFVGTGRTGEASSTFMKVWKMKTDGTSLSEVYSLSTNAVYSLTKTHIWIDAGDIYVSGQSGANDYVWKNGTQLHSISGHITSVVANSNGVYHCGSSGGSAMIWKDGSLLYTLYNCERATRLFIAEPECTNSDVRSLPFNEGFENGSTSWPCWTKIDSDNNNGGVISYWTRWGKGITNSVTIYGNHCAGHRWNGSNNQEGWLISPQLFLQPGRDETKLTFKSYEGGASDYKYEGVWISTTGTATSNFTQVWTQSNPTASWKTVTIDLTAYQGHAVYIAFKYTGTNGHTWLIDDVSVTEEWDMCYDPESVPFTHSFDNWNWNYTCWYNIDDDKTGGKKCWQYDSSNHCVYHPYGQNNGVKQYGYLYSPNIELPSGHDYVLKFKTKTTSSGTNMQNRIYLREDGTEIPATSQYQTMIWTDNAYSSNWTEVEVPLSAYAGHTISLEFNYQGTYAHNWFIKDVRVEQTIAQYTITANSNNNSWGTVSGGGTYNNGATCTLTATPTSGYQFQNWKKNGTIVSTNATYSFTVTENATYTATFGEIPINYYTITTAASPTVGGTVSGGGTFQEGSSTTLTATANTGYSFSKWQDNNTQNPRTITVTQNATYTATFTQNHYTVSVYASPSYGGTVSGGGSNFTYGSTATLTATPADGYEFQGWSDGSTDNPHQVTVFGDATYTATFAEVGATYFSVTTNVTPAGSGTVTGGGTYEAGTNIVLTATPNTGYTFQRWNDNSTTNPRPLTVTTDMSFTAHFEAEVYTVVVVADPTEGGTVSGSGNYAYGSTATLTATANSGYEFQGWSDGSTENPHQVTITGNATYTATFTPVGATYYTVTAAVSPAGSGSVSGTGVFAAGSTTTLQATANIGYTFKRWNDNSTMNPRLVTVNNNMSFTAFFEAQQYTVTVNAIPEEGGTVTGGGNYAYGATATLRATPNANYTFTQWADGVVQNPRTVTVTENATYTAVFSTAGGETYTLTLTVNDPSLGTVMGGGSYPAGTPVQISAYPNAGAEFVKWSDGSTRNPRVVRLDSDMTLEAEFASAATYTITVNSADPTMGQAFGGGTFHAGEIVEISAIANEGYEFMRWSDGNSDNPRTITVTENATYTATFAATGTETHRVILICNADDGTVTGDGVYVHGATATIEAFPAADRVFDKWSDGSTDNPRSLTVNEDITLVAFFRTTGIDENGESFYELYPNPTNSVIRIAGIEPNTEVKIYNSIGMLVKVVSASSDDEISVTDLASGLYLVRFDNVRLRFVKTL
ncbi:MAG: choice-of-anchor J domain-containing protein [Bacteroidales bacterium]|nr:choice-of-anchor J domain-containing protein [Bacteroidales bacterium]